jgi:hypothetical protein
MMNGYVLRSSPAALCHCAERAKHLDRTEPRFSGSQVRLVIYEMSPKVHLCRPRPFAAGGFFIRAQGPRHSQLRKWRPLFGQSVTGVDQAAN